MSGPSIWPTAAALAGSPRPLLGSVPSRSMKALVLSPHRPCSRRVTRARHPAAASSEGSSVVEPDACLTSKSLPANPDRHLASATLATNRLPNLSPDSVAGSPRGGVGRFRWPRGAIHLRSSTTSRHKLDGAATNVGVVGAVCVLAVLAILADLAIVTRSGAAIARSSFQF